MEWTHGRVIYAALSDAMSIDDYAGCPGLGAASLLWRNRDGDFPAWAGHDLTTRDPTAELALLASDGATSTTVAGDRLGRLRRLGVPRPLATVTMAAMTCRQLCGCRAGRHGRRGDRHLSHQDHWAFEAVGLRDDPAGGIVDRRDAVTCRADHRHPRHDHRPHRGLVM
jgi:hypothetical protein